MPEQKMSFGYPPQAGTFTGEWEFFDYGHPSRRRRYRVPIYQLENGERITDMLQMEKVSKCDRN